MEKLSYFQETAREKYFHLVKNSALEIKILVCVFFTIIIGLSGQVRILLPFTPVPITGQVYMVLLSGALMGRWAAFSLLLYLLGGMAGIPWFAAARSGFLFPTFGYLLGFVPASFIVGFFTEKSSYSRKLTGQILVMLLAIAIIYGSGITWLSVYLGINWEKAFLMGAAPFIPFDMVKAYLAAWTAYTILPARK